MTINFNDLHIFVQAVENGGFAAAARRLGLPKSTISKRVAELESSLDTRLLHRTSRSFVLTDPGRDFFDHARAALIQAEAAETSVRQRRSEPSGVVRITASVPAAQFFLANHLPTLAIRYPKLTVQLHATDRFVDMVQEGFDIALRSHFSPLPDSGLLQRQMSLDDVILVAAPSYLETRPAPSSPGDLKDHDGLFVDGTAKGWRLRRSDGHESVASPRIRFIADEMQVLLRAASAGLGVVCLPAGSCRSAVNRQELVRVLPDWIAGTVTTSILTTHKRGQLPGVRAVVDYLVAGMGV